MLSMGLFLHITLKTHTPVEMQSSIDFGISFPFTQVWKAVSSGPFYQNYSGSEGEGREQ